MKALLYCIIENHARTWRSSKEAKQMFQFKSLYMTCTVLVVTLYTELTKSPFKGELDLFGLYCEWSFFSDVNHCKECRKSRRTQPTWRVTSKSWSKSKATERLHWNNWELFEPTRSVSLPPFPQIGYFFRSGKGAVCFALLEEHCITHKMPHPNKACNCRTRKMNVQNCLNCYDIDEVYRGRFQLLSWRAISCAECSKLRKASTFQRKCPRIDGRGA